VPVVIPGVTPSEELREQLKGHTVLLSFSRGKDSIAAWLALREAGVHVKPYHLYLVPGLRFVRESLEYFAEHFGLDAPILDLPHPTLFRWLNELIYQPPERCAVIESAKLPSVTYEDINNWARDYYGLSADTWVCDGVRATDSPNRRMAIKSYGPINEKMRTQKVVWDWRVADVRNMIDRHGVRLPPDYLWFGRSYDGLDLRFTAKLRTYAPDDYERVLQWFPLAPLDSIRAPV
jgi:hypothetical protein